MRFHMELARPMLEKASLAKALPLGGADAMASDIKKWEDQVSMHVEAALVKIREIEAITGKPEPIR